MKLTPLLTSHAVVQRDQTIPVWGWTDRPRTRVRASLGTSRAEGISGDDARFLLRLPALPAGGPHTLVVESLDGGERLEVPDILVGGKGLTGGYAPMGGVYAAEHVVAPIAEQRDDFMFFTYGAHPMGCAVAD